MLWVGEGPHVAIVARVLLSIVGNDSWQSVEHSSELLHLHHATLVSGAVTCCFLLCLARLSSLCNACTMLHSDIVWCTRLRHTMQY